MACLTAKKQHAIPSISHEVILAAYTFAATSSVETKYAAATPIKPMSMMPTGITGTLASSAQSAQALASRNHMRVTVVPPGSVILLERAGSSPLTSGLATINAMVAMRSINLPLSLRSGAGGAMIVSGLSNTFFVLFLRLMILTPNQSFTRALTLIQGLQCMARINIYR